MATLLVFICFLGFFLLYNTSKKAILSRSFFLEKWAQQHPEPAKILGYLLMLLSLMGCIFLWGKASGIFGFIVILMTVASATVLLAPLRSINYKLMSFLFLFFLIFEVIVK